MGWREEGDPRVQGLKAPGLWARALDRGRGLSWERVQPGPSQCPALASVYPSVKWGEAVLLAMGWGGQDGWPDSL